MFRKLCMLLAMVLAIGSAFVADAEAQGDPTCDGDLVVGPVVVVDPAPPTPTPAPTATPTTDTAGDTDTLSVASANAQSEFTTENCADALVYPGPFTNTPIVPPSPYAAPRGISSPAAVPAAPVTPAEAPAGSDLAHSGSEVVVLAYLGTGLLAFGAVALGVRRGGFVDHG